MSEDYNCNGSEPILIESKRENIKMPELLNFKMITKKKFNFSFSLPDKINEESTFKTNTKKIKEIKSKCKTNLKSRQSSKESVKSLFFLLLYFF